MVLCKARDGIAINSRHAKILLLFKLGKVSIVRDGNDLAFILITEINATNLQETELRIHQIDASGIPTTPQLTALICAVPREK